MGELSVTDITDSGSVPNPPADQRAGAEWPWQASCSCAHRPTLGGCTGPPREGSVRARPDRRSAPSSSRSRTVRWPGAHRCGGWECATPSARAVPYIVDIACAPDARWVRSPPASAHRSGAHSHSVDITVGSTPTRCAPRWAPLSGRCIVARPRSASAPDVRRPGVRATRARGGACRVGSPVVASAQTRDPPRVRPAAGVLP